MPKSRFNFDSVNTLRQGNTGILRAFQVGEMVFHSEAQRGATFGGHNLGNLAQKAFKPLPGKGLRHVPQKCVQNSKWWHPLRSSLLNEAFYTLRNPET